MSINMPRMLNWRRIYGLMESAEGPAAMEAGLFLERLERSRGGGGVLFCGAGFSADALNFSDLDIGASANLLSLLNHTLKEAGHESGFKDVRNAAQFASEKFGELGLMGTLVERYRIKNVSSDMVDIVRYPWARIYTTNYDNALEISAARAGKKPNSVNNLDDESKIQASAENIIHLHGFIDSWNIRNFSDSCILTADSYHKTSILKDWLELLRQDIDRAGIVVFVGFNAADFHLNEVLRNAATLKEKVFFVNRASAEPDLDVKMTQSRFGTPMYLGRIGFADAIRKTIEKDSLVEPPLASFHRYSRSAPAESVPSTKAIEGLFLFGDIDQSLLGRDIDLEISDYRVSRAICGEIISAIANHAKIVLITGEICDGKTLITEELCRKLDRTRPVFLLGTPYDDLLEEVSALIEFYKDAVIVIENCFDIRKDRLVALAMQVNSSSSTLIFSSRNIAAEARPSDIEAFRKLEHFREFGIPRLGDGEADHLIALADQIAGWSEFAGRSLADRRLFVANTCNFSLPSFLLRLLHSGYVRDRYKEEFNKIELLQEKERHAIIAALYISHIGERPTTALLSDVFSIDIGGLLTRLVNGPAALRLLRRKGDYIETVPAIGATNILKEIVSDRDIVLSVVEFLRTLSGESRRDQFRRHIFSQMMRYSIIRTVVEDRDWITRFFDNISKIEYMRRQVLFWLQWSIALREGGAFLDAEKKLEQAYREAELFEKRRAIPFDRRQLDDVRAKFLVSRAKASTLEPSALFRDIKESIEIVSKLLRLDEITHHPFETLEGIVSLFLLKSSILEAGLRNIVEGMIRSLIGAAEKRVGSAPAGYQDSMATRAFSSAKGMIAAISTPSS